MYKSRKSKELFFYAFRSFRWISPNPSVPLFANGFHPKTTYSKLHRNKTWDFIDSSVFILSFRFHGSIHCCVLAVLSVAATYSTKNVEFLVFFFDFVHFQYFNWKPGLSSMKFDILFDTFWNFRANLYIESVSREMIRL